MAGQANVERVLDVPYDLDHRLLAVGLNSGAEAVGGGASPAHERDTPGADGSLPPPSVPPTRELACRPLGYRAAVDDDLAETSASDARGGTDGSRALPRGAAPGGERGQPPACSASAGS